MLSESLEILVDKKVYYQKDLAYQGHDEHGEHALPLYNSNYLQDYIEDRARSVKPKSADRELVVVNVLGILL